LSAAPTETFTAAAAARGPRVWRELLRHSGVAFGGIVLLLMLLVALCAPLLGTLHPAAINPAHRNLTPGEESEVLLSDGREAEWVHWMGTDSLGRDVYSRVIYGARVSLMVGVTVAVLSIAVGLVIGLVSGYIRWLDGIVMRVMDGLMAIPGILLAIALVSLSGATLWTVIVAIVIPEIPRVVRLVRSVVLSVREEPYVEAAIAAGTRLPLVLSRHVLPNTIAPLIVQATYICGSAMILESILGFLGAGIPPEIPSWGNIMAEGRTYVMVAAWIVLFPGIFLTLAVLGVNLLGDGLRDTLDPRLRRGTSSVL
jgi:peptide/nickel transport system permease protein